MRFHGNALAILAAAFAAGAIAVPIASGTEMMERGNQGKEDSGADYTAYGTYTNYRPYTTYKTYNPYSAEVEAAAARYGRRHVEYPATVQDYPEAGHMGMETKRGLPASIITYPDNGNGMEKRQYGRYAPYASYGSYAKDIANAMQKRDSDEYSTYAPYKSYTPYSKEVEEAAAQKQKRQYGWYSTYAPYYSYGAYDKEVDQAAKGSAHLDESASQDMNVKRNPDDNAQNGYGYYGSYAPYYSYQTYRAEIDKAAANDMNMKRSPDNDDQASSYGAYGSYAPYYSYQIYRDEVDKAANEKRNAGAAPSVVGVPPEMYAREIEDAKVAMGLNE